jgi:predicted nucleotidyltransferase
MPQTLVDLLIEKTKREEKYFKNYLSYAKVIKKEAQKLLGEVRVLIFGSVLKKDEIPRDIDILIISSKLEDMDPKNKREIRTKLWKAIGFTTPFEIHLIKPQDYKEWYKNFIKEFVEI